MQSKVLTSFLHLDTTHMASEVKPCCLGKTIAHVLIFIFKTDLMIPNCNKESGKGSSLDCTVRKRKMAIPKKSFRLGSLVIFVLQQRSKEISEFCKGGNCLTLDNTNSA